MKWFGEKWNAPICTEENKVPTPVGEPCGWCEELFEDGDNGVCLPTILEWNDDDTARGKDIPHHIECFLRQIVGSFGHLRGLCSCEGGDLEDPPEMTRREAAVAAVKEFERQELGR